MDFSWTGIGDAVGGVFSYLGAQKQAELQSQQQLERDRIAASNAALAYNSQTMQASLNAKSTQTLAFVALGFIALIILMRVRPTANG